VIPFSLAELFIAGFALRQLTSAGRGLSRVRRGEWRPKEALAAGALRFGSDAGIVVALFYLLWGFHYARLPLEERHGWRGAGADEVELSLLAQEMVDAANAEYVSLHGTEDRGAPTGSVLERGDLVELLGSGWRGVEPIVSRSRLASGFGDPKPLMASRGLDYLGISGFYFPWTGEANFNRGTPPVSLPQVVAHEMSHQRGYAREDEANFMGYLVAVLTPHPYPRYSGCVFAQRQLLATLARHDRERALELVAQRHSGVQRDIDAARAYWARFEGPASRAAGRVNNAYLKGHRVPGGILSYRRSVELLVAYARSRGGRLLGN
jgi:hypothetical protein